MISGEAAGVSAPHSVGCVLQKATKPAGAVAVAANAIVLEASGRLAQPTTVNDKARIPAR